jgi:hypothetical protein
VVVEEPTTGAGKRKRDDDGAGPSEPRKKGKCEEQDGVIELD